MLKRTKPRPALQDGPGLFGETIEAPALVSLQVTQRVWNATLVERRQLLQIRQAMWDAIDRDDPDRADYVQAVVDAERAYTHTMVRRIIR